MRVLFASGGTHGDVQPAVAFARGLLAAGHEVRFASHDAFAGLVEDAGLHFVSLDAKDPRQVGRDVQQGTIGKSALVRLYKHLFWRRPPGPAELARYVEICRGQDQILSSQTHLLHAAEALRVPHSVIGLYPTQPTGSFPHHLSRLRRSLGGPLNRLSHGAFAQLFWQPERRWVDAWRQELGLSPLGLGSQQAHLRRQRAPHFYGYSRHIIPKPHDWDAWMNVTGYWFLDSASAFAPPAPLQRFLEGGSPPVVIGFGSLVDPNPSGLRRVLLEAIAATGERALILSGWGGSDSAPLPPQVFQADWIPLPWLLSRARAIVSHSGAGTVSEALRAGIPSVAVPYSGEQKFWAGRLCSLGAAPAPISRLELTAEKLAQTIRTALTDGELHRQITRLAREIQAENGVANAVAAFEEQLTRAKTKGR